MGKERILRMEKRTTAADAEVISTGPAKEGDGSAEEVRVGE
ncbi:hypothetical protein A2U01_0118911, partial [Trifolium medium]|nr:hypothetical protein [Trifolium medium]